MSNQIDRTRSRGSKARSADVTRYRDELDQLDLLSSEEAESDEASNATETDLSATVDAFHTRIQRRKKQQEEQDGQAERETKLRHSLMLEALMNIRRSLRDVARIDLGERFSLKVIADDWEGWPRIVIRLEDYILPEADYPFFQVTAHDRQQRGSIEIIHGDTSSPERISLVRQSDLKRLPASLKKCARHYLDVVGDIVLEAERNIDDEVDDREIERKNLKEFEESQSEKSDVELSGDLFVDEDQVDDVLDSLPSLEDVESLPELSLPKEE